jgi:hypothetical protein
MLPPAGGRRSVVENCFQGPQIMVTHDFVETLSGSEESRGHPAQDLVAVLPASNPAGLDPYSSVQAFDDVGSGQVVEGHF